MGQAGRSIDDKPQQSYTSPMPAPPSSSTEGAGWVNRRMSSMTTRIEATADAEALARRAAEWITRECKR